MTLIVDRTEDRPEATDRRGGVTLESEPEPEPESASARRRIDVTDLHAAGIEEFVESNLDADDVSLEHRGGRTFLLLEE